MSSAPGWNDTWGSESARPEGGRPEAVDSKAGSSEAGSSEAGSSEAGSSEAGSSEAGSSEAGSPESVGHNAGGVSAETPPHRDDGRGDRSASTRGRVGRRTVSCRPARELGPDDDAQAVARQVCLDQLSYTGRTRAELAAALAARGVPDEVADGVLDRFAEVGLVDDEAFARSWVAQRSRGKGLARRALSQELRRRGVADTVVEAAVAELEPDDEYEQARLLVSRRLGATARLETATRVRRLVGVLARKGHPTGRAYDVVREALAAEGVDAGPAADHQPG